jgi:hypothetical protein
LAHGPTSSWLLLELAQAESPLRSSIRIQGQAKIVWLDEPSAMPFSDEAWRHQGFISRTSTSLPALAFTRVALELHPGDVPA